MVLYRETRWQRFQWKLWHKKRAVWRFMRYDFKKDFPYYAAVLSIGYAFAWVLFKSPLLHYVFNMTEDPNQLMQSPYFREKFNEKRWRQLNMENRLGETSALQNGVSEEQWDSIKESDE